MGVQQPKRESGWLFGQQKENSCAVGSHPAVEEKEKRGESKTKEKKNHKDHDKSTSPGGPFSML